jgi:hypothetical protein
VQTTADHLIGLLDLPPSPLSGSDLIPGRAAVDLAGAAYLGATAIEDEAKTLGFHDAELLEAGSAQAGILDRSAVPGGPPIVVISLRGTGGEAGHGREGPFWRAIGFLRDVWRDIRSYRRSRWHRLRPTATVGAGFRDQAEAIYEQIENRLTKFLVEHGPATRVFVIGHSLGGALAPLIGFALRLDARPVHMVVQVEPPRPGGQGFADAYHAEGIRTLRIVNTEEGVEDIITDRLPPSSWPFNARHLGGPGQGTVRLLMLTEDGVLESPEEWERYRAAHPVPRWRSFTRLSRGIRAHLVETIKAAFDELIASGTEAGA